MALTVFSDLTMDDVSNLSILRLPVWSTDLSNASGYDFNEGDLTPKGSPAREPFLTQDLTQDHPDNLDYDQASINTSGTNYDYPPSEPAKDALESQAVHLYRVPAYSDYDPWRKEQEREEQERESARTRARDLERSAFIGPAVSSIRSVSGSRNESQSGWGRRDNSNDQVFELPAFEDDEFPMQASSYPGQEWCTYVWADD